jgi:hypothetical protein
VYIYNDQRSTRADISHHRDREKFGIKKATSPGSVIRSSVLASLEQIGDILEKVWHDLLNCH